MIDHRVRETTLNIGDVYIPPKWVSFDYTWALVVEAGRNLHELQSVLSGRINALQFDMWKEMRGFLENFPNTAPLFTIKLIHNQTITQR